MTKTIVLIIAVTWLGLLIWFFFDEPTKYTKCYTIHYLDGTQENVCTICNENSEPYLKNNCAQGTIQRCGVKKITFVSKIKQSE